MSRIFIIVALAWCTTTPALARVEFSPYVSISSTKAIKPGEIGKETSTTKQRTTYGLRAMLGLGRLFKLELSGGQSKMVETSKVQDAKDDLGQIDYEEDLAMDTSDPESEIKTTETQRQARLGIIIDPSFSVLVARAKVGVQATQREMELEQAGMAATKTTEPITYKPYAGAGLGIRFSSRFYAIAEYNFFFFAFPEAKPFTREVAIAFAVSM